MNRNRIRERIKRLYVQPGNPTAFAGITNVSRFHRNYPSSKTRQILSEVNSYTLHRQFKRMKYRNPYYVTKRRDVFQADLVDIQQLAEWNDGVTFLLLVIDTFTKYVWIRPVKSKRAAETAVAAANIFDTILANPQDKLCNLFETDEGREFTGREFQEMLRRYGVRHNIPTSELKCMIAERAVQSFERIIYQSLTEFQTRRYIDRLQLLAVTYNGRYHRMIKMSPRRADLPENEDQVSSTHRERFAKLLDTNVPIRFKVGDKVRVKTDFQDHFRRGYNQQWSLTLYEVIGINTRMPIPMYKLRNLDTEEDVAGSFYSNELQKVANDGVYQVERVIRRQVRNGVPHLFVKWIGFSNRHNSWVRETDVVQRF